MTPIELYLSPAEKEGGQTLSDGLNPSALAETGAKPEPKPDPDQEQKGPLNFIDPTGDLNSLLDQGWAIIRPAGDQGKTLTKWIWPLLEHRAEDLDLNSADDIKLFDVPPGMDATESVKWVDEKLIGNTPLRDIPGYICILGGPELVSFELQQILSASFAVGRIAFDRQDQYTAYIEKLLRWERGPKHAKGRALFFTARDGTAATELGHRLLMQPTIADINGHIERSRYNLEQVQPFAGDDPFASADSLLDAAAVQTPSFLMSCSHGLGAPRRGWNSPERQRALQGALCLGEGETIASGELTESAFLPGGLWFYFACFGMGTPRRSAYYHWLSRLKQRGEFGQNLDAVLHSLPQDGAPGFLSALPKTVLANPNGPLAVIGHLDLAWSYSFQAIEQMSGSERHRRFEPILDPMLRGQRIGLAVNGMQITRNQVKTDLAVAADDAARAEVTGATIIDDSIRLGHRWMLHHDIDGYILLGDPAAYLAVEEPQRRRRRRREAAPAPEVRAPEPATLSAPEPAASATPAVPAGIDVDGMEEIVHALIEGEGSKALAKKHGVDKKQLEQWKDIYTEAGRRALAALLE